MHALHEPAVRARPTLHLEGVGVRFGGLVALDEVSLTVHPGEVVGVMGPNGAGKTTLFNVITGFVKPTSGTISIAGRELRPRPHHLTRLGVARTLQGLGLFAGLTVLDNVVAGARHTARAGFLSGLLALPSSDRDEHRLRSEAVALLDSLGIRDVAGLPPSVLPYAVRKRVALARALIARPRLLLLDEPAGGLGHDDIEELGALVTSLPATAPDGGEDGDRCSILLVEHNVDLVMSVCDRIAVLDFGRLIATGTPAEVRDDPAVTEAYLGVPVDEDAEGSASAPEKGGKG